MGNKIILSWAIHTVIKHMLPPSNAMGNVFQTQHIYYQSCIRTNIVIYNEGFSWSCVKVFMLCAWKTEKESET